MNSVRLNSGESGAFGRYAETETLLRAEANPGILFSHWLVNGERREGNTLTVRVAAGETVTVETVGFREEEALMIAGISAKGEGDWIRLYNAGTAPLNLGYYSIADSPKIKVAGQRPDMILESGDSVILDCRNNAGEDSLIVCGFNLSEGETVCLWDQRDESMKDWLKVPRMTENEVYELEAGGSRYVFSK